jgi:hypothetical protein
VEQDLDARGCACERLGVADIEAHELDTAQGAQWRGLGVIRQRADRATDLATLFD